MIAPKVALAASARCVERVFSIERGVDDIWPSEAVELIAEAIFAQQKALEAINARLEQHFVGGAPDHPELNGEVR